MPLSQRRQVLLKFYGEERKESPIKEMATNKKMIQKMVEDGDVTQFFGDDLMRLYEVMDEYYDEYLTKTKDLKPKDAAEKEAELEEFKQSRRKGKLPKESNPARNLHLKSIEEAKCLNKL